MIPREPSQRPERVFPWTPQDSGSIGEQTANETCVQRTVTTGAFCLGAVTGFWGETDHHQIVNMKNVNGEIFFKEEFLILFTPCLIFP